MLLLFALIASVGGGCAVFLVSREFLLHRDRAREQERRRSRLLAGGAGAGVGVGLGLRVGAGAGVVAGASVGSGSGAGVPAADGKLVSSQASISGTTHKGDEQARSAPRGLLGQLSERLRRREDKAQRQAAYERELPALLEVIGLGMQAGMGFDQAFELYACRFDTPLAQLCQQPLEIWQRGLTTREMGMHELADKVDSPFFKRFVATALRSLRYGAPMTRILADLAQEARKDYRAKREALVAKAPVKMLLPTGALILPAMLLLVMGPIILDLMGRLG